jgi:hypothetical protein
MKKRQKKERKPKISKGVYLTPRILALVYIVFISLFALDVFGNGYGFWGTLLALFMHLIPSLILIAILVIAWRWKKPLLAGIVFTLGGVLYIARLVMTSVTNGFEWYMIAWSLQIAGPAILTGILFIREWKLRRKWRKK